MKLNIEVTSETLPREFVALARLFNELGGSTVQVNVVTEPATAAPVTAEPATAEPVEPVIETRRRRRTKVEMEAGAKPEVVEPEVVEPEVAGEEKAFSEGDVQALATLIARSKGPDVVRNKIAELGCARISALTAKQINELGTFLESQK